MGSGRLLVRLELCLSILLLFPRIRIFLRGSLLFCRGFLQQLHFRLVGLVLLKKVCLQLLLRILLLLFSYFYPGEYWLLQNTKFGSLVWHLHWYSSPSSLNMPVGTAGSPSLQCVPAAQAEYASLNLNQLVPIF